MRRSLSFIIYLTPDDWREADGGALRVFDAQPTGRLAEGPGEAEETSSDVAPLAGSLVLFDSAALPHSVLPTRRERIALVGWLLEPAIR